MNQKIMIWSIINSPFKSLIEIEYQERSSIAEGKVLIFSC